MKRRCVASLVLLIPCALFAFHQVLRAVSRIVPPPVDVPLFPVFHDGNVRRAGPGSARSVGKILEVRLRGTPEAIGAEHAALLHEEMAETERVVWDVFAQKVTNPFARFLLLDAGQFAYRKVATGMSDEWRRELAATAARFRPDPFEDRFETFQRFVYLATLYDISLAYEASPLVGCTTFTVSGSAAASSPILARTFDMEVSDVFDRKKAVFLVSEDGLIPFASVAWPGLVGVVSGMNREGLAVVVHGARAGPTHTVGEPLVEELRRLLSRTRTTEEAVDALRETNPLVSHIVVVMDAAGRAAEVERVPGAPPFVRFLGERAVVTNHLEGPFASDPKNVRIRQSTTTLARRARGEELLRELSKPADAVDAVSWLRDRRAVGGAPLALGDRRAIDALIATHAVVMETAKRRLWVSEAPHVLGRFVAFDLGPLLDPNLSPSEEPPHEVIAADPLGKSPSP